MRFKNTLILFIFHSIFFIVGTVIFILLFHTPLFKNTILFYRGIIFLLLSCTIITPILLLFRKKSSNRVWTYKDIVLSLVLIFNLNLIFFTHLPVTADRSVSVFMLGYLNNNSSKSLTSQQITNFFTNKYLYEYGAMNKRLNEQIESGNIMQVENGYQITKQGQFLMKVYHLIANIFAVDDKLVSPANIQKGN